MESKAGARGNDGEATSSGEHRPRRRGAVELRMQVTTAKQLRVADAGPPWLLLERRAASAEKLAPPQWPSFMALPTLHYPVGESKSNLVSTSRAGVITQIVEAAVARIAMAERALERR
jgi:hypothetical protein